MKQPDLGLNLTTKRTRKREFLAEMERVVPWAALVALITPYAPETPALRRGDDAVHPLHAEHELAPQILALVNELLDAKGLLLRAGTQFDQERFG